VALPHRVVKWDFQIAKSSYWDTGLVIVFLGT
jgi:hypothetical protein